jgi:hypothetical protein
MTTPFSAPEATLIFENLSNAPTPPGGYAHFINVGTDFLLDIIEKRYFEEQLSKGLGSCLKKPSMPSSRRIVDSR